MKYKAYIAIDKVDDDETLFLFDECGAYSTISISVLNYRYRDSGDAVKCWCHDEANGYLCDFPHLVPRFDDMIDPKLVYEFDLENEDD